MQKIPLLPKISLSAHAHNEKQLNLVTITKIPNEQPAFECQPAFGSHSQLLVAGVFFAFFIMLLPEPLVCMIKMENFYAFSIIFDHANVCASTHSLVEIHNIQGIKTQLNLQKF
jgi:hypothetical protein